MAAKLRVEDRLYERMVAQRDRYKKALTLVGIHLNSIALSPHALNEDDGEHLVLAYGIIISALTPDKEDTDG